MELFLFFEIDKVETFRSEKEFHETSRNLNSIRKPIEKIENNNWLNKLNELKFCEVSQNSIQTDAESCSFQS